MRIAAVVAVLLIACFSKGSDLAVTNLMSGTLSVLLNTAVASATTPSFAAEVAFPIGSDPYSVALGDFNGDSKPDLAVANEGSSTVSILVAVP